MVKTTMQVGMALALVTCGLGCSGGSPSKRNAGHEALKGQADTQSGIDQDVARLRDEPPKDALSPADEKEPVYKGKPLSAWIAMLRDEDVEFRRAGLKAVVEIGVKAREAVPDLINVLRDADAEARLLAALALGKVGPPAKNAVPALMQTLEDKEWKVRTQVILSLSQITADATPVLPALRAALGDENPEVRVAAALALGRPGPAAKDVVSPLIDLLQDWGMAKVQGLDVSTAACRALAQIGKPAVPALIQTLQSRDSATAGRAAEALGKIGPAAKEAVKPLLDAARDKRSSYRYAAMSALGDIGPAAKDAVGLLIGALSEEPDNDYSHGARVAARALGQIGPDAKEAIGPLIAALKRKDIEVRKCAAKSLGQIGKESVLPLIAVLKQKPPEVPTEDWAALARGDYSPKTKPWDQVHDLCVEALGLIGKPAVTPLLDALQDGTARRFVLRALKTIGPDAREGVPRLIALLRDKDADTAGLAADALSRIGQAEETVPALAGALQDDRAAVRESVVQALGDLGPAGKKGEPALQPLLRDGDPAVRRVTAEALRKIRGEPEIPGSRQGDSVEELLRQGRERVRERAAREQQSSSPVLPPRPPPPPPPPP